MIIIEEGPTAAISPSVQGPGRDRGTQKSSDRNIREHRCSTYQPYAVGRISDRKSSLHPKHPSVTLGSDPEASRPHRAWKEKHNSRLTNNVKGLYFGQARSLMPEVRGTDFEKSQRVAFEITLSAGVGTSSLA